MPIKFSTVQPDQFLEIASPGLNTSFDTGDLVKVIGIVEPNGIVRGVKCENWSGQHHDFTDHAGAVLLNKSTATSFDTAYVEKKKKQLADAQPTVAGAEAPKSIQQIVDETLAKILPGLIKAAVAEALAPKK